MTALTEYQRLEASGLWRPTPDGQRRDVIVSLGDASLVLTNMNEVALTHWSLPAIIRISPLRDRPAIYKPGEDAEETLEIDDETMIAAIERIHGTIRRGQSRPGRLRGIIVGGTLAVAAALAVFWLPDAMIRHTVTVVPEAKRTQIGRDLLTRMRRVAGPRCSTTQGARALTRLKTRLMPERTGDILVLPDGIASTQHLPGGIILLDRSIVEDYEDPDVTAGFILAELERIAQLDPLERLLRDAGLIATFKLLTTGDLSARTLDAHAERLLSTPPASVPADALLARFEKVGVRSTPYAYALDISGETTLPLIEADPVSAALAEPVLSDLEWVALQGICGG